MFVFNYYLSLKYQWYDDPSNSFNTIEDNQWKWPTVHAILMLN